MMHPSIAYDVIRCILIKDDRSIAMWLPVEWAKEGTKVTIDGEKGWIVERSHGQTMSSSELAEFIEEVKVNGNGKDYLT